MKRPLLKLYRKNIGQIITLANNVVAGITGNAHFPTPPITMANLTIASDALAKAHEEANASKSIQAFSAMEKSKVIVVDMLRELAVYVDGIAMGDKDIIVSANMPASKDRSKQPPPEMVTNIIANFTGIPGSIKLNWNKSPNARMYRVYMTETPTDFSTWKLIDTITVRKIMVQNLISNKKFYFKVVAVGTAGVSADSEIADAIAA